MSRFRVILVSTLILLLTAGSVASLELQKYQVTHEARSLQRVFDMHAELKKHDEQKAAELVKAYIGEPNGHMRRLQVAVFVPMANAVLVALLAIALALPSRRRKLNPPAFDDR